MCFADEDDEFMLNEVWLQQRGKVWCAEAATHHLDNCLQTSNPSYGEEEDEFVDKEFQEDEFIDKEFQHEDVEDPSHHAVLHQLDFIS